MKTTFFCNENGIPIGTINTSENLIQYMAYNHGLVGQYDIRLKKYYRFKTYSGNSSTIVGTTDYGTTDLLYWGAKR